MRRIIISQKPELNLGRRFSYFRFYKTPFAQSREDLNQFMGQLQQLEFRYNAGLIDINQALEQLRQAYNNIVEYLNKVRLQQQTQQEQLSATVPTVQKTEWQSVNQILYDRNRVSAQTRIPEVETEVEKLEKTKEQVQESIVKAVDNVAEKTAQEAESVSKKTTSSSSGSSGSRKKRKSPFRRISTSTSSTSTISTSTTREEVKEPETGKTIGYHDYTLQKSYGVGYEPTTSSEKAVTTMRSILTSAPSTSSTTSYTPESSSEKTVTTLFSLLGY